MTNRLLVIAMLLAAAAGAHAAGNAENPAGSHEPSVPDEGVRIVVERAERRFVSPNGGGPFRELQISPHIVPTAASISALEVAVYGISPPLEGEPVWRWEFRRGGFPVPIPRTIVWDGTFRGSAAGSDGGTVPDGDYVYLVTAVDTRGVSYRTAPLPVTVDTRPPVIEQVVAEYGVFSPTGDGRRDTVRIFQSGSREAIWTGQLRNANGRIVREFVTRDDRPPTIVWDGRTEAGVRVPDATYYYVLTGTDRAGNRSSSAPLPIVVHTLAGDVRLAADAAIVPVGDAGVLGQVAFDVTLAAPGEIVSWELTVAEATPSPRPTVVLARDGGGAPAPQLVLFATQAEARAIDDGDYLVTLAVRYRSGARSVSDPVRLTVDRTPPAGVLAARTVPEPAEGDGPLVFGGPERAAVELRARLSDDDWALSLVHAERIEVVPLERFEQAGNDFTFVWNGLDRSGATMPDGLYRIRMEATGRAGNRGATNEIVVQKDTRRLRTTLTTDIDAFSPNGSGNRDSIVITAAYDPPDGITSTRLEIVTEGGRLVHAEAHPRLVRYEWAGRTSVGALVPDGRYTIRLEATHRNGDRSVATAGPVVIDTVGPSVHQLGAPYRLVRPTGDGDRDTVRILQWTSAAEWTGRIVDSRSRVILERHWSGHAEDFVWDGRDGSGTVVPDGEYGYELTGHDVAGNVTRAELTLVVDTTSLPAAARPPRVAVTASPSPFTPTGDGADDPLRLALSAVGPNEIHSWALEISTVSGRIVRTFRGRGAPAPELLWDGRYAGGELVESGGSYRATLVVTDVLGNRGEASVRIPIGLIVLHDGVLPRIMVPAITFAAGRADLFGVPESELERNLEALRSLAEVLRRFPERDIVLEGHAAHDDLASGAAATEQGRSELVALSLARAEEVRRALVILGTSPDRVTVAAMGAVRPVVPHDDGENNWQNRRVESMVR